MGIKMSLGHFDTHSVQEIIFLHVVFYHMPFCFSYKLCRMKFK
jgi:hypothetical protein